MRLQWIAGPILAGLVVVGALWWASGGGDGETVSPTRPPPTAAGGADRVERVTAEPIAEPEPPAPIEPERLTEVPRELQKLLRGNPAPGAWAEEFPEDYDEEFFTDTIVDLLVDCDMEHRVVDVTCDEAPCMVAWSAPLGAEHPSSCKRWAATFGGRAITRVGFDVDCPDGRRIRAELATPHEALLETVADPDAWDGGRMAHRAAAYTVADWCE